MENSFQFETHKIIPMLWNKRKMIIIVAVIAAVVSSGASFVIKPKFKSNAIVYPVNLSPTSEESTTEQLLQYLESDQIKESLLKTLDLGKHYGIDTNQIGYKKVYNMMWKENVSIAPTLYQSVEINVIDEKPEMAKKINEAILASVNELIKNNKRATLKEYVINSDKALALSDNNIKAIADSMQALKDKYNMFDMMNQSKYLSKSLAEGKSVSTENLKTIEGLKTKEQEYTSLRWKFDGNLGVRNGFIDAKQKYLFEYNSDLTFTNVVSKPTLPDAKCYPIRWLIVTIATLSAIALAAIYLIITNASVRKLD